MEFKYPNVKLSSFFNKKEISYIINFFLDNGAKLNDELLNNYKRVYTVPGDTRVQNYKKDDNGSTIDDNDATWQFYPDEKEMDLFLDYLTPLFSNKTNQFRNEIDVKLEEIHNPESRYHYISVQIEKVETYLNKVEILYSDEFFLAYKEQIINELNKIINYLGTLLSSHNLDFSKDKIKLKLGKNEVYFLFKKLNELEVLEGSQFTDSRIGELLEKHFLFYDKKIKSYKPITGMYKYIQKIKTDTVRNQDSEIINSIFK